MERTSNKQIKNCGTCPYWSWGDQRCYNEQSWSYHQINEHLDSCEKWSSGGKEKS